MANPLPFDGSNSRSKTKRHPIYPFILVSGLFLSVIAVANPIVAPNSYLTGGDPNKPEVILLLAVCFFLEIACFLRVLSQSRKPRFLAVWLLAMHLVTYPAFLWWCLWLELGRSIRPAYAIGSGELLVMIVEGLLTYLICRYVPSSQSNRAFPSVLRCLLASLIGNLVSAIAPAVFRQYYGYFS
jgi:hypothetical protein